MPVPRNQIVDILFTKGLNEAQDDRVIAPDDMAKLENAQFSKQGSIDKRHGLAKFPAAPTVTPLGEVWDGNAVRGASYEREELLFSRDKLWSLSRNDTTSEQGWVSKGLVPKGHTQRRGVARNSIQSLQQPDCDNTQGYRLYVWSEPEIQDDILSFDGGASHPGHDRTDIFKDPFNVLPFNRNDGTFVDSSAGNLQNWPTNCRIRCALEDFETDMWVWCDELVATFATNPKVVAPGTGSSQDNIIVTYIRHKVVYDVDVVSPGATTWTWTQDGVAKQYVQAGAEADSVTAAAIAAIINGVSGWTASSTGSLIEVTGIPRTGTITEIVNSGVGTIIGPQLDRPQVLRAVLVDTADLGSKVQDKTAQLSVSLNGKSLYDIDRIVGSDNLALTWDNGANILLHVRDADLNVVDNTIVVEATIDVLAVHADSNDDEYSIAYGIAGGSIRFRIFDIGLTGETGNSATGFGSGKRFYQCSIEDSISGTDLVVAIERDHVEGEEPAHDGFLPVVEWRRFNASATEQGLLQVTNNVRLLSQLLMGDAKVMANVGHADSSDLRKSKNVTIDFSQQEQGTAFLCDFRLDTALTSPDVLLRPMNLAAFFDTQVRRTQNHLSNFEFPGPNWGQYLSTHAWWTNPVVGRRYTAIKQEDLKPRTYSVDGIDRWAVDLGGDAHFEHVTLGNILHVADGMVYDYDGCQVVENNFLWTTCLVEVAQGSGDLVAETTYFLTAIIEWRVGSRVYRSMPAVPLQVDLAVAKGSYTVAVDMLNLTYKASYDDGFKDPPRIIFFGTTSNGEIFHRLGTLNGTSSGTNGPIKADPRTQGPTSVTINYLDATILGNERLYTDGGTLENMPCPGARLIARRQNSLYCVGEDARLSNLSQEFQFGGDAAAVAFNQLNAFRADDAGDVTATAVLDEKYIIFKRTQIFVVYGEGPSPTGAGTTLTRPQVIASDVGCIAPRSVVRGREGIFFQSAKGVYLLDRGLTITYIGLAVEDDFDGATISDAVVSADEERVHFVVKHATDSYVMCYDGTWQQWSKWTTTFNNAIGGIDRLGTFTLYIASGNTYDQDANYTDDTTRVHMLARTGWVKVGGIQGFQRVNSARILYRWGGSVQNMRVKVYRDYQDTPFHNKVYTTAQMTGLDPPQWEVPITIQKCEAIRFEVSDEDGAAPAQTDFQLTAITVDVGLKGTPKKLPNAQRG
jgi:hypothetical protein